MDSDAMAVLREAGLDVEGAMGRLMNNQAFYFKMLNKFQQDTHFAQLRGLVEAGDAKGAGECAHAMKGMCATLGMTALSDLCARLQFLYQGREEGDPAALVAEATREYDRLTDVLKKVLA